MDLNPTQYAEPLVCSHCSDPATEDDPTWEGLPVHPGCVDMDKVSRRVWTDYPSETDLEEAAVLFEMSSEQAKSQLKKLRATKRRTCEFCRGVGVVRVVDGPHAATAICSCVGKEVR